MSVKNTNLSGVDVDNLPKLKKARIGIVVSEWNKDITSSMLEGTIDVLLSCSVKRSNIKVDWVPGSFELPLGAQFLLNDKKVDAVICIGCIIQGETRHFGFISQAVAQSIAQIGLKYNAPVIFGVLTTNNMQQAIDRSGGKHGNKGTEAGYTAVKMLTLQDKIKNY
jgi:6,7-dimethyl-8-ribityllumazine synthase